MRISTSPLLLAIPNWLASVANNFSLAEFGSFLFWAALTILIGFLPIALAYFWTRFHGKDFLMHEFYLDGALLFIGPAILGALYGDLFNRGLMFETNHKALSIFSTVVLGFVVLISSMVYAGMRTQGENSRKMTDPYFIGFVGEISWGITGASAIYVMTVVALYSSGH